MKCEYCEYDIGNKEYKELYHLYDAYKKRTFSFCSFECVTKFILKLIIESL